MKLIDRTEASTLWRCLLIKTVSNKTNENCKLKPPCCRMGWGFMIINDPKTVQNNQNTKQAYGWTSLTKFTVIGTLWIVIHMEDRVRSHINLEFTKMQKRLIEHCHLVTSFYKRFITLVHLKLMRPAGLEKEKKLIQNLSSKVNSKRWANET